MYIQAVSILRIDDMIKLNPAREKQGGHGR